MFDVKKGTFLARLTLCADDYGLNADVNDAILALVKAGRLNAVSCMAVGSAFEAQPLLDAISGAPIPVQIGLHLTLTEYKPLTAMPHLADAGMLPPVGSLLLDSHLRRINRVEIAREFESQFDAFEGAFGRLPDFMDGHQHIQIFPGIREDVINLLTTRKFGGETNRGWVRCCDAPTADLITQRNPRAILLAAMARRQRTRLARAGLHSNERFYGVNTFDQRESYRTLMRRWLRLVAKKTSPALIMCHPGQGAPNADDPISARRLDEFTYLDSPHFPEDLATLGLSLG